MDNKTNGFGGTNPHMMYGIIFTIIAVVALMALVLVLVLTRSQADDTSQSTIVSNTNPTIDTVVTSETSGGVDDTDGIPPTESSTKTVYILGTATDNNGCETINTIPSYAILAYRSGITCTTATTDNNQCYASTLTTVSGCTGAGDLSMAYETNFPLQFYADPTDTGSPYVAQTWVSKVTVTDNQSGTGFNTDTFEVNSLLALDVTGSVSYGTVGLGNDSTQQTITFTNTGNRNLDASQSASGNMVCTGTGSQSILVSNARISNTSGFLYAAGYGLASTSTPVGINLAQRASESINSTVDWYAVLRMPTTGVSGTCTNTVTFTATADV